MVFTTGQRQREGGGGNAGEKHSFDAKDANAQRKSKSENHVSFASSASFALKLLTHLRAVLAVFAFKPWHSVRASILPITRISRSSRFSSASYQVLSASPSR